MNTKLKNNYLSGEKGELGEITGGVSSTCNINFFLKH